MEMSGLPHRKTLSEPPLLFALPATDPDHGALIPIAEAVRGRACNALCPRCREPVIAKRGARNMHHFSHAANTSCSGAEETALHRFAKERLSNDCKLFLPALTVEHRGLREPVLAKRWITFDRVEIEQALPGLRPDLIGYKFDSNGVEHRLLIEIHVTHRVDERKLELLRRANLSAIEIDLSQLDRFAPTPEIAARILGEAPRHWLHHHLIPEARRRIDVRADQIQKRQQAAIASTAEKIIAAATGPKVNNDDVIEACRTRLLEQFISHGLSCAIPALETDQSIQARVLLHLYETFLQANDPGWHQVSNHEILKAITPALIPWLNEKRDRTAIQIAKEKLSDLVSPTEALLRIVAALIGREVLTMECSNRYRIGHLLGRIVYEARELRDARRERSEAIEKALGDIFRRADADFRNSFEPADWMSVPHGDPAHHPISPSQAVETGGPEYLRYRDALQSITAFLFGTAPEPSALLDLDLKSSIAAEHRRRAERAERRRLVEAEERRRRIAEEDAREQDLRAELGEFFPEGVSAWIGEPYDPDAGIAWPMGAGRQPVPIKLQGLAAGSVPLRLVRSGSHSVHHVMHILHHAQKSVDRILALRQALAEAARRALPTDRVEMFLGLSNPKLANRARPLDHVVNEKTLQECLDLLPRR